MSRPFETGILDSVGDGRAAHGDLDVDSFHEAVAEMVIPTQRNDCPSFLYLAPGVSDCVFPGDAPGQDLPLPHAPELWIVRDPLLVRPSQLRVHRKNIGARPCRHRRQMRPLPEPGRHGPAPDPIHDESRRA